MQLKMRMKNICPPQFRESLQLAALVVVLSQVKVQAADYYVACVNDNSQKVEVYDPGVTDWNSGTALKWSFAPTTSGGWNSTEVAAWNNPGEVKLRWSGANQVIVTSCDGGLVTEATYPGGSMVWAQTTGGAFVHGIELLPNGNVAICAPDQWSWVRVYAASQGNRNNTFAQYNFANAHSVLWDPQNNLLWALGTNALIALNVGGTAANPTLSLNKSVTLPATGGHDLSPFYGDPDKFWVTTSFNVWIYSKSANTFTAAPGSANRSDVKGCSSQGSGEIVQCQLNGTAFVPTINFFTPLGASDYNRTRTGAGFYKSRVFSPDYAPISLRIDVMAQGSPTNSNVDAIAWNEAGGWTGWVGLNPLGSGKVAVCSYAYQYLNIFARGTDNALWTKYYSPATGWSTWSSLGGHMASDPCAVAWRNPATINVFYQGTNNQIMQRAWQGSWNTGEIALASGGTPIAGGAPAACSYRDGWLNLYIRGATNDLRTISYSSGWSGWSSLGGHMTSDPGTVAWTSPATINVFYQGTNNQVVQRSWQTGIGWNAGENALGGTPIAGGAPSAASFQDGWLNIYVRGATNDLRTISYSNGWSAWSSLGGIITSDPGSVSWTTGH